MMGGDLKGWAEREAANSARMAECQIKLAELDEQEEYEERLRDEFAMAALTGMLANPDVEIKDSDVAKCFSVSAYQFADVMLEARKETNG